MDSISVSLYGEYAEYLESLKYIHENLEKIDKVVSAINYSTTRALESDIRSRLTDLVYILNEAGDKFFIGTVDFKHVEIMLHGSIYVALKNIFKYLKDFLENPSSHNDIDSKYKRDHILLVHTVVQDMMKELNMKL